VDTEVAGNTESSVIMDNTKENTGGIQVSVKNQSDRVI
jgi:hypothetical protein